MGEGGIIIHETSRKLAGLIASLLAALLSIAGGVITLARNPNVHPRNPTRPGGDVTEKVPEMGDTWVLFAIGLLCIIACAARWRHRPHLHHTT